MTMFQELISNYKNSILTTGIIKIKTVYLISKSATQTRYNKKKKKTGKKKMNLKMFTINVSGNKIWQMTNGGSIGSCYSMDNVRQEKRFLVIFTWNCLDFTRSIAESIIGPRLSFKPNTVGRCRTIDCRRSRGFFFFPWEKVNRETRTRFHERYHSSLVCLKPTCESRFISYSYQQYLFILLRDIILYRINVESRILLLLRINALI